MVATPLNLNLNTVDLTDEQFYQLCQNNRELNFERTPKGELIIMSLVGGETANREADMIADLGNWNRITGLGFTFSSSTGFKLPNGGVRVALLCKSLSRCGLDSTFTVGKSYTRTKA